MASFLISLSPLLLPTCWHLFPSLVQRLTRSKEHCTNNKCLRVSTFFKSTGCFSYQIFHIDQRPCERLLFHTLIQTRTSVCKADHSLWDLYPAFESMSGRTLPTHHRFSRQDFQRIPSNGSATMANPNDATIDIPLATVTTRGQTGARNADDALPMSGYISQPPSSNQHLNEKAGLFHRNVAGRRRMKAKESDGRAESRGYREEEDTLTRMGKIYNKVMNFSIMIRYFVYVLPLAALIAVPIVIGATVAHKARLGGVKILWLFTWIEVVWLSLWIAKVVARSLPSVFQFLCGIVSSGTRKYRLILKSLEIPFSLAGWALASLATFIPVRSTYYFESSVTRANNDQS